MRTSRWAWTYYLKGSQSLLLLFPTLLVCARPNLRHQWGGMRVGCQTLLCQPRSSKGTDLFSGPILRKLNPSPPSMRFWTFPTRWPYLFSAYEKLPVFGKPSLMSFSHPSWWWEGRHATRLKPDFRVISKSFIGNVVPRGGHEDFLHPLEALFLFPHH